MRFGPGQYAGAGVPVSRVEFPDFLPASGVDLSSVGRSSLLLGVDQRCERVSVDLSEESPHVLVNAGTGGGKSAIVRFALAQHVARGGLGVVLDYKRISHRWCRGLDPVIHRAVDICDIGDALVSLGRELHRRTEIVEEFPGSVDDAPVGPEILVAFEELNATLEQLRDLDRKLPRGTYTAVQAYRELMFLGRAVGIRVMATAQLASWKAIGGPEVGANFATRVLLRYDETAWRWLVGARVAFQADPDHPGRGMVCRSSRARLTQFVWLPEGEARSLVLSSPEARSLARDLSPRSGVTGRVRLPSQWAISGGGA